MAVDQLAIDDPSSLLQNCTDSSVRVSRNNELREIRELQPVVEDVKCVGSATGGIHCCCIVADGYLAHPVRIEEHGCLG